MADAYSAYEKYKKYYEQLNGVSFTSATGGMKTGIQSVNTKINSMEATVTTNRWTEKGIKIIKNNAIPAFKGQAKSLEEGLSVIEAAIAKIPSLLTSIENLKKECDNLQNAIEQKNSFTDADSDPEKADSLKQNVDYYEARVKELDEECAKKIEEINGTTLNIKKVSENFALQMKKLKEAISMESRRAEFVGSLNDNSWTFDESLKKRAKELTVFDNTTGDIYTENQKITMHVGETRRLTVRLPHNYGKVDEIIRTTADGDGAYRTHNVAYARCDIDPDPNVVDYVNYKPKSKHTPQNPGVTKTHYYDWIIEAVAPGHCKISQTCEYYSQEPNAGTPKAMISLNLDVVP